MKKVSHILLLAFVISLSSSLYSYTVVSNPNAYHEPSIDISMESNISSFSDAPRIDLFKILNKLLKVMHRAKNYEGSEKHGAEVMRLMLKPSNTKKEVRGCAKKIRTWLNTRPEGHGDELHNLIEDVQGIINQLK